jgi:MYXO-CTERM domain-containing protein
MTMRKFLKVLTLTGLSALGILTLPAQAGVILFQDNFDTDFGTSSLNFNTFNNWTVSNGTVDYIRTPNSFGINNCTAGCVDIDGSTGDGGRMTSKTAFALEAAHTYRITLDITGNQRNTTLESLTFGFGVLNFTLSNITSNEVFTSYWVSTTGYTGMSSLFLETASNDNVGAIIDNVIFECETCEPASVPEPGMFGLLGLGLLGLRIARKRKNPLVAY